MEWDSLETFESKAFLEKFLETLVYELLRRTMYYSDFRLTSSVIKSMAHEFKTALKMDWFFPTYEWVEKFRSIYNLQDVNTKTLSIGYDEAKSTQMHEICRELIPSSMSAKMPASVLELTASPAVQKTCSKQSSVFRRTLMPKTTKAIESLDKVEKAIKSAVANDVENEFPLPAIKEKLSMNGVKLACKKKYCESTIINSPIDKIKSAYNPIIIQKVESKVPPSAYFIPQIYSQKAQIVPSDKSVVETMIPCTPPCASTETTTKTEESAQAIPYRKAKEENIFRIKLPKLRCKFKTNEKLQKTKRNSILNRPLKTTNEALRCITILEEFAMMKENFRLIGLIERLEKVILQTI